MFARLDVQEFLSCFTDWISGALSELSGEHVSIDGKALIAATRKSAGGKVPFILNAYASGLGITVCQLEIGEKDNEITEIPRLLDMIDISGCTVTIDAIGTQVRIMDLIHEKGGDFCLQLKRNHRKAFDAVNLHFSRKVDLLEDGAEPAEAGVDVFEDEGHGHGRNETRTYFTTTLEDEDRSILPKGWDHVRCLGMAVQEREVIGSPSKGSVEVHFHVLSRPMGAEEYAGYARGHWGIENGPRHVLDVSFGEDGWRAREGNAKSNLALLRKICLNLVMQVKDRGMSTNRVINRFQVQPETFRRFLFEDVPARVAEEAARA